MTPSPMQLDRRDFLKGCCAATLAGGSHVAVGATASTTQDTLVVVFLRGAMDALSLLSPGQGHPDRGNYEANRDNTRVPYAGTGAGLPLGGTNWQLHPRAAALKSLYTQGHLALVVGAGQMAPNPVVRSHFEAQANLETGVGGGTGSGIGWLTRHLVSANLPANVPVPAVSMGSITASSLLGSTEAITMNSGQDFRLDLGNWPWNAADNSGIAGLQGVVEVLPSLWQSSTLPLAPAGLAALDSLSLFRAINFSTYAASNTSGYQPSGGASYGGGGFGLQLQNIAQLVKHNVGLRIATVDLGGWDTHNGQGSPADSYDYFGNQVQVLNDGLNAFYTDLSTDAAGNYMKNVSVVTVSEFGRRVQENASGGTDHGYGTVMLAMGASVNGGQIYGTFPGLASDQLFEGADVAVTTDYRRVLAEALVARLGNANVGYVFPGYSGYAPLGIFQTSAVADTVFKSGFE
ncbi:MAG TPA: DUF1501 domain-containing protein [Rudaea sp.]|nr:DUF1501 domain-containing protein [Rudaea sp.]